MSLLWLNMRYNSLWVNLTGNLWSLFYCSINMLKLKWKEAMLFDIIFHFIVMYIPWTTFPRLLMFKWNRKEAVVFDIIFHLIVNTVRKIAEAEASWLTLSSTLLFAELPDFRPRELTLSSLTREVRTTEDASPKFAYLVLRNTRRPTSPDYLPILLGTLDRDGNADINRSGVKKKTFLGKKVPGTNCSR